MFSLPMQMGAKERWHRAPVGSDRCEPKSDGTEHLLEAIAVALPPIALFCLSSFSSYLLFYFLVLLSPILTLAVTFICLFLVYSVRCKI